MDNLDNDEGSELEEHRLEMPGATIIGHRMRSRNSEGTAFFEEMRAALDLDPDCEVARVFEVRAERTIDGLSLREMRYHDGVVPRISVTMDEDNKIEVAVFSYASGSLRRYGLNDLVTLCDLAKKSSDTALQSLELAHKLGTDNDRLKAENEHLRKLLDTKGNIPSAV